MLHIYNKSVKIYNLNASFLIIYKSYFFRFLLFMNIDNITYYTNFQKTGKVNFCYISNFIANFHPKNINENIKFWLKIDILDIKKNVFLFFQMIKKD